MRAAAFLTVGRRVHGDSSLRDQIVELEGFNKIRIPDHAAVFHVDPGRFLVDFLDGIDAVLQDIAGAEDGAIVLHALLHFEAEGSDRLVARCVAQAVKAREVAVGGALRQFRLGCARFRGGATALAGCATEDDKIDQRVGAETVGAVYGDTGRFADGHQTGHDRIRVSILLGQYFAMIIGRDAAHIVVNGRKHRDRLFRDVHASKDFRRLGDARQAGRQDFCAEMLEMEVDMILLRADTAALADFHGHGTGDHVARREVFC